MSKDYHTGNRSCLRQSVLEIESLWGILAFGTGKDISGGMYSGVFQLCKVYREVHKHDLFVSMSQSMARNFNS